MFFEPKKICFATLALIFLYMLSLAPLHGSNELVIAQDKSIDNDQMIKGEAPQLEASIKGDDGRTSVGITVRSMEEVSSFTTEELLRVIGEETSDLAPEADVEVVFNGSHPEGDTAIKVLAELERERLNAKALWLASLAEEEVQSAIRTIAFVRGFGLGGAMALSIFIFSNVPAEAALLIGLQSSMMSAGLGLGNAFNNRWLPKLDMPGMRLLAKVPGLGYLNKVADYEPKFFPIATVKVGLLTFGYIFCLRLIQDGTGVAPLNWGPDAAWTLARVATLGGAVDTAWMLFNQKTTTAYLRSHIQKYMDAQDPNSSGYELVKKLKTGLFWSAIGAATLSVVSTIAQVLSDGVSREVGNYALYGMLGTGVFAHVYISVRNFREKVLSKKSPTPTCSASFTD